MMVNCNNSSIGSWGCVYSEEFILMEERERFLEKRLLGATMICVDESDEYIVVRYKNDLFHIKRSDFTKRESPAYVWGDIVLIKDKEKEAVIDEICWHYNEKVYFYMLTGIKKRYYKDQLILVRQGADYE